MIKMLRQNFSKWPIQYGDGCRTIDRKRRAVPLIIISNFYKMTSLNTSQRISPENQPVAILKICPPNITLLQKTKNPRISKTKFSQF